MIIGLVSLFYYNMYYYTASKIYKELIENGIYRNHTCIVECLGKQEIEIPIIKIE